MNRTDTLSRRRFIQVSATAGAGLVLGFHLPWGRRLPIQPEDLRRS